MKALLITANKGRFQIKNQFYQETLELTNLKKFISECKFKDNTIIGDNGMNVSGGQKQRIAIARAIINQP